MTEQEWLHRYKARLEQRGMTPEWASDCAVQIEFGEGPFCYALTDSPEDAADDEADEWRNDQ